MVMSERPRLDISPHWFAMMFRALWKGVIWRHHEFGVLNSERALQGHLVGALSVFAPELVALVEPTIVPESRIKPDLWIGLREQAKAIAVVELKYVPHYYPEWEKDFASLTTVITSECAAYDTHPVTGRNNGKLTCTEKTIAIFAVVGRHDADAVDSKRLAARIEKSDLTASQRSALPHLLHACGTVDVNASKRDFDADWLLRTEL